MTSSSIDLSRKIDRPTADLLIAVDRVAAVTDVHYLIVGASARDLLLHYGYGLPVARATADTDSGVQVDSWAQFERLRDTLVEQGFKTSGMPYRLISQNDLKLDLVPFGGVEDALSNVALPPKSAVIINVLGFEDASNAAIDVKIAEEPPITAPVASAPGLALLKTIAWTDRAADLRAKDAADLLYIARAYEKLPDVELYGDLALMEQFEYDVTQIGAYLLGSETVRICSEKSKSYVGEFLRSNSGDRTLDRLIDESLEVPYGDRGPNERILRAYAYGYLSAC